ncbi:MAG: hypothetical protein GFH27_549331n44 [Chloroflexi bacterium AL-W]|nr:hypothetical protein [Chloroflexi bacterium AL-N1]NOK70345.1 hypothetical protein [Chloroflexi bacterium AL-N10]NOK78023.1 hypothetical protein [Chloroflexi bacterium AL-N5]NOK85122.1 hypothetical protein [Chloroflexi bacterium AL-W]NOK92111.1 hypothetical protein [Chloroflexi bacterium AL-N15]
MNTYAEAIEWFQQAGWIALPHTWEPGETIVVAASKQEYEDVSMLHHAVYLYRRDGVWIIHDLETIEQHFGQLQDAVFAIHEWLLAQNTHTMSNAPPRG